MENQEFNKTDEPVLPVLTVNHLVTGYLLETARWAKLLAIIGFVATGLIAIMALFAGTLISAVGMFSGSGNLGPTAGIGLTVFYLLVALLVFIPSLYLFRFSGKTGASLTIANESGFTEAMMNLKSYFKFNGIIAIVVICFYTLGLILALVSGVFFSAMM
jgi:hypothetical protein